MDSGCSGCSPRCNVLRPGVRVLLDRVAPGRHRDGGTDSDAQFCRRGFGPALAGAVVTWLDSESVRAWARQIVRWRVAPRWYLAAFVLPLLVVGLASVAITLLGTTVDPTVLSGRLSLVFGSYVFVALIGGETRNRAGEGSPSRGSRNGTRRSRPRSFWVSSGRSGTFLSWSRIRTLSTVSHGSSRRSPGSSFASSISWASRSS